MKRKRTKKAKPQVPGNKLKIAHTKEKTSKKDDAFDSYLRSQFEKVGGPWSIKESGTATTKVYVIANKDGQAICSTRDSDIAETLAVIPQIICTYLHVLDIGQADLSTYESQLRKEAVQGLYSTAYFAVQKHGRLVPEPATSNN